MVLRALKSSAGFSRNMLKDKWSTPGSELMQTLRRGLFLKCTLYLSQQCINSLLSFKFQGRKKKKKSCNKVKVFTVDTLFYRQMFPLHSGQFPLSVSIACTVLS